MKVIFLLAGALAACISLTVADARTVRSPDDGRGVPPLNVRQSCADAEKFSISGSDKNSAFKGCMQDEMSAKDSLNKGWSKFKPKDRKLCLEEAGDPSPSYVEMLTCLEMSSGTMTSSGTSATPSSPKIGGPVAPGLLDAPKPSAPTVEQ